LDAYDRIHKEQEEVLGQKERWIEVLEGVVKEKGIVLESAMERQREV
jgi:hypothetical protein